jgi:LDH2 family malate/lactate/ureidoglycolate dehydrogenase
MAGAGAAFARVARDSGVLWACTLALDRVVPIGMLRLWRPCMVPAPRLGEQIDVILDAWGMAAEQRAVVVEKMLYADVHGIDSHGCCMLPFYQRLRSEGRLNAAARAEIVHETATTALVDGGGGLGHVPSTIGMERAIAKCRDMGVGAVAVRNSGHFGAAGAYARMAVEQGFIGIATTSTPTPSVVPTFGRDAMLGTNPIAFAAPAARNPPFVLDMATSAASLGKMVERWRTGHAIPSGWAIDARGLPITNGRTAAEGRRLMPLGGDAEHGGYKGYGLAAVVEILSSVLPGVALAAPGSAGRATVGHFLLAIDPARFLPDGAFGAGLDELIDRLHAAPPMDAADPVLVPGDPEHREVARRRRDGIPLTRSVFEDIRGVARAAGVPFVLDASR